MRGPDRWAENPHFGCSSVLHFWLCKVVRHCTAGERLAGRIEGLVLVEGETSKHKTSRTKEAKSRLLPFTAIGNFLESESWGKAFVKAWKEANSGNTSCFIPEVQRGHHLLCRHRRPLSSSRSFSRRNWAVKRLAITARIVANLPC